jgi:hypothetical protein
MKASITLGSLTALLLCSCLESSPDLNRFDAQIVYLESEGVDGLVTRLEIDRGGRAMLWQGTGSTLDYVGQRYLLNYKLRELENLLINFDNLSPNFGPAKPAPDSIVRSVEVSTVDWHHEVSINENLDLIGILMDLLQGIEDEHN